MATITAKQLQEKTEIILDRLEAGEEVWITRKGRAVARLEPVTQNAAGSWDEIMNEVWRAQARIKRPDRRPNPVVQERQRRRR